MRTALLIPFAFCLLSACSKAPTTRENEALRRENAALSAKNVELSNRLAQAESRHSSQKQGAGTSSTDAETVNAGEAYDFKEIVAYSDASGDYTIYFILTDKDGRETTADGRVEMVIYGPLEIFRSKYDVRKSDFKIITRGRGALSQRVLACVLPRVSKFEFKSDPVQSYGETSGKIHMNLYTRGTLISGDDSIYFK